MDKSTTFKDERTALKIPAPTGKTHCEHWHENNSYFGIRIMRARKSDGSVAKTWLCRVHEAGRDRRQNLGRTTAKRYDVAHQEALEIRNLVFDRRRQGITMPTWKEALDLYTLRRRKKWSPDTVRDYANKAKYLTGWDDRRVDQITEEDTEFVFNQIQSDVTLINSKRKKPAIGRDGLSTAISCLTLFKSVLSDLQRRHVISKVPLQNLIDQHIFDKRPPRTTLIKSDQLPAFWEWLHRKAHPAVRDFIILTLFMAVRRGVAESFRWSNLLVQGNRYHYLMLADQRGNKPRIDIAVPIPDFLVENVIKPRLASPLKHPIWIIESMKKRGQPLVSVRGSLAALKRETGIDIDLHDLRRTIATIVNKATGNPLLAKRALTHSVVSTLEHQAVTGGYLISDDDDQLNAMNKGVAYLLARVIPNSATSVTEQPSDSEGAPAAPVVSPRLTEFSWDRLLDASA
jgi:hypothetical protein